MAKIYDFPRDHVLWFLVEQRETPAEVISMDRATGANSDNPQGNHLDGEE